MARRVVVLPAPLAPSSATTSPSPTARSRLPHHRGVLVAGGEPLDAEGRAAHPLHDLGGRAAQVGLDHARIAAHFGGRTGRDQLAELEHEDLVADAQHEAHVVVDQEHRRAAVGEPAQPAPELGALARVQPGRRLVQAQQPRAHRDRARHPDQLALPLRQVARHQLRRPVELDQRRGPPRPPPRRATATAQVLAHAQVVEQLGALPGARQPEAGARVRRETGEVAPVELDGAGVADEAGHRVHERRLAGAVRPDQPHELALGHLEIEPRERMHAAEAHGHVAGPEHRRHGFAAAPLLGRGARGAGRRPVAPAACVRACRTPRRRPRGAGAA